MVLAIFEASSCSGDVIWLKTMAGMGIISTRKAQGNKRVRKKLQPRKNTIKPASTISKEKAGKEELCPHLTENELRTAQILKATAPTTTAADQTHQSGTLLPDDKGGEERNAETVREIGIMPPLFNQAGECGEDRANQKSR